MSMGRSPKKNINVDVNGRTNLKKTTINADANGTIPEKKPSVLLEFFSWPWVKVNQLLNNPALAG